MTRIASRYFNQIKGFDYFQESHAASFAHLGSCVQLDKCHYPDIHGVAEFQPSVVLRSPRSCAMLKNMVKSSVRRM
jgi:DNA polymerase III alpha subunit